MRIIRNYDVASYYPHLMTVNGYTSRNIPDAQIYEDMLERRMAAKKSGDKSTANALKLIANTTYGATLNQYNDLYDPLMARSVCISGQLYLIELSNHLYQDVPDLTIVQTNTDGIMVEFDEEYLDKVHAITEEWQRRTGFELEEDCIRAIYQKDVNGYIEVAENGSIKSKGGYLVRGIAPAGAFKVNNNACIVSKAITEYFVNGTPVEKTIGDCDDPFQFQMIAKAGSKYKEAYHLVDGEKQKIQKVNRVYATADIRYGKLYKVKSDNDSEAKIDSLPEHCIIDNSAVNDPEHTKIEQIDKQFYIDMANKRINDFKGVKPEKIKKERKTKMASKNTTETKAEGNVLQKLNLARKMFLDANVKQSGQNNQMMFTYFELKDIIPLATDIFQRIGITHIIRMDTEAAYMDVINSDDKSDLVTFSIPMANWDGNRGVNPIQVCGMKVTYYRRYLYQMALDICEQDEIDDKPRSFHTTDSTPEAAPQKPATPAERAEVKKELTNADGQADDLQMSQLKKNAKILKDKSKGTEMEYPVADFLEQVAQRTEGFTAVSKSDCAKILARISSMIGDL